MNNDPSQSLPLFCSSNQFSYPPKSIVISNIGLTSQATLTVPNQPRSIMDKAQARGPLLIFNNPPMSQCYLLNFASQTSGVNLVDINNIKVQFIYDYSNTGGRMTSTQSSNIYGGFTPSSTSKTNSG
jgi:hypothetical protein